MTFTSPPSNTTSIFEIIRSVNADTGNYLGFFLLLSIFAIMFISMKNQPVEKSLGASSFITAIFAIILWNMNLINQNVWIASIFLASIGLILLVYNAASSK
jgi:hypothetical protein